MSNGKTKRQQDDELFGQLKQERESFKPQWQELGDNILPTRPRFYTSDVNKGQRKNTKIIDSTATQSAHILRSGMMSGFTSPAKPWFRLTTPDSELAEFGAVKRWLYQVTQIMSTNFAKSNLYNTLPMVYGDLGVFGTAPISIEPNFRGKVFHTQSFPVGSYAIGRDFLGRINIFGRDFKMTVRQLVDQFGLEAVSKKVKKLWDDGQTEQWIEVRHMIQPNKEYQEGMGLGSKFKKFRSCYWESDGQGQGYDSEKYLRESGYDYFPVLVPRWEVTGEDTYATSCPGMVCLGDIKQLQLGEKRTLEAIEKMIRPPLKGPSSLRQQSDKIIPGGIVYVDRGVDGFTPVYEVRYSVNEMEMKNEQVRNRIRECFFTNLFIAFANHDGKDVTARFVNEVHEEKLLVLGPVTEQLNYDFADPFIDLTFNYHMEQGLLPPPPPDLEGVDLKVEYISVMAQAQKMIGVGAQERFAGYMSQLIQVDASAADKWNIDQTIDNYADALSIPPNMVRTDEEVEVIRAQKAKIAAAQQEMEMIQGGAKAAKDLGQAQMGADGETVLQKMAGG